MADYSPTNWVENVTKVGPTRMNALEQGLADAAKHNATGTAATRPAADAAHKNWIWRDSDTGAVWYCDGANWYSMNGQRIGSGALLVNPGGNAGTSDSIMGQRFTAQSLIPSASGVLGLLRLSLGRTSIQASTAAALDVRLYSDNSGVPGAQIAYFGQIPVARLTNVVSEFRLRPASKADYVTLTAGTKVWVVLDKGAGVSSSAGIVWGKADGSSAEVGSTALSSTGASGSWGLIASQHYVFAHVSTPAMDLDVNSGVPDLAALRTNSGNLVGWLDNTGRLQTPQGTVYDPTLLTPWLDLPLNTSFFANYDAAEPPGWIKAQYKRFGDGMVRLRGMVKSVAGYGYASAGAVIGTLPAGFRPTYNTMLKLHQLDSAGNRALMRADVSPTAGTVRLEDQIMQAGNNGTATWVNLDGAEFDTAAA